MRVLHEQNSTSTSRDTSEDANAWYLGLARLMAHNIAHLDLAITKGPVRHFDCEYDHFRNSN